MRSLGFLSSALDVRLVTRFTAKDSASQTQQEVTAIRGSLLRIEFTEASVSLVVST